MKFNGDLVKLKSTINENGLVILENFFKKKDVIFFKEKLWEIFDERKKKNKKVGNSGFIYLPNYFKECFELTRFFSDKRLNEIIVSLLGFDYVLLHAQAINVTNKFNSYFNQQQEVLRAGEWHIDTKSVNNVTLPPLTHLLVTFAIDDFKEDNGATHYVNGSNNFGYPPERNGKYKHDVMLLKAGDVCILDGRTWHRGGAPSNQSRWGAFTLFGPWWCKPYYRYWDFYDEKKILEIKKNKILERLFHFKSLTPDDENVTYTTLISSDPSKN